MSAALENTLSTLAIAQSIAINLEAIYRDRPRNKTALKHAARLNAACNEAFAGWQGQLKAKAIARIARRLEHLETIVGWGDDADIAVYTSTALGLLEELRGHLPPYRRLLIDRVIAAVYAIHRHFDRRDSKQAAYDRAEAAIKAWREYAR
jgi:hypothetical protein